jgi:hypothetical protein
MVPLVWVTAITRPDAHASVVPDSTPLATRTSATTPAGSSLAANASALQIAPRVAVPFLAASARVLALNSRPANRAAGLAEQDRDGSAAVLHLPAHAGRPDDLVPRLTSRPIGSCSPGTASRRRARPRSLEPEGRVPLPAPYRMAIDRSWPGTACHCGTPSPAILKAFEGSGVRVFKLYQSL